MLSELLPEEFEFISGPEEFEFDPDELEFDPEELELVPKALAFGVFKNWLNSWGVIC
jgi:hypothetical protein